MKINHLQAAAITAACAAAVAAGTAAGAAHAAATDHHRLVSTSTVASPRAVSRGTSHKAITFTMKDGKSVTFHVHRNHGTITKQQIIRRVQAKYNLNSRQVVAMDSGNGHISVNPAKVTETNTVRSMLDDFMYQLQSTLTWTHNVWASCGNVANVSHGHSVKTGGSWGFDKYLDQTNAYYAFQSCSNTTGYKSNVTAQFVGTCLGGTGTVTCYRSPTNKIWGHDDGSYYWEMDRS